MSGNVPSTVVTKINKMLILVLKYLCYSEDQVLVEPNKILNRILKNYASLKDYYLE